MRPEVPVYLRELIRILIEDFGSRLPTAYEQGAAKRLAMLTQVAAEEFDRAAARRIEENGAMRALFRRASSLITDPALQDRLRAASTAEETSFLVRDLDRSNSELRALLLDLHSHVENLPGADARTLEDAIWNELSDSTERRALSMGRF